MEQQDSPAGVMLVAIDRGAGLYVWLRPHNDLAQHTIPQAAGYSRALPPFPVNDPPEFLGPPVFFPKETVVGWDELEGKQTNSLNRAIAKATCSDSMVTAPHGLPKWYLGIAFGTASRAALLLVVRTGRTPVETLARARSGSAA